jgi:hypothetical protein
MLNLKWTTCKMFDPFHDTQLLKQGCRNMLWDRTKAGREALDDSVSKSQARRRKAPGESEVEDVDAGRLVPSWIGTLESLNAELDRAIVYYSTGLHRQSPRGAILRDMKVDMASFLLWVNVLPSDQHRISLCSS